MRLKIACLQLNASDNMEANIAAISPFIEQACAKGAQLVALPENAFLMEAPGKRQTLVEESLHPGVMAAKEWAKRHGIWLLIGSVQVKAEVGDEKRALNRSLLISPDGEVTARYDKIHLFDVELPNGETYAESAKCAPGGQAVLASMPWGNAGMTICYDVRFPQLYRMLAHAGASILFVPAAFTQTTGEAHWHVLLRTRAIENGCFVVAPAQTGTHAGGRKTYGHSLIVDPWGKVLADGGAETGVVMAEINLSEVEKIRARIPSLKHDREFTLSRPQPNN